MAFITLSTLVTDPFVAALCNTLVHSLWQGLVLAALTGFIIILTRKASAATRYNLLIAALMLFAVGVSLTFITQLKQVNAAAANKVQALPFNNTAPIIFDNADIPVSAINTPVVNAPFSDKLFAYLNHNHNTIVLVWFLIICAKSIQLGFGLWGVNRLKTKQVSAVSVFWNDRIQQLANSLAIKQTISLLESGLTKVPMVIGNLKPVILMPIGLLTALTTAEVEAILVHELAHIKRRDYLVNLLQSLMEIVFFFNPAVLWVSQLIKAERENCCDDLALAQSSNKVNYIRALVSCEEYQQSVPAYAMAFPGGKSSLFDRVKRIAGNRNHSLNLFEKTVLAICLVVSGLCMSAYAEKENIKRAAHAVVKAIQHVKEDVAPSQQNIAKQVKDEKDPQIQQVNPPILTTEMPTLHDAVTIQRPDTDTVVNLNLKLGSLKPMAKRLDPLTTGYYVRKPDTSKIFYGPNLFNGIMLRELRKDGLTHNGSSTSLTEQELIIDGVKQPEVVHQKYWAMRQAYDASHKVNGANNYAAAMGRWKNFSDEMLKDGLIKSRTNNSYHINEDEFIINGVKQPEDVHQKYLELFETSVTNSDVKTNINADVKTNINTNAKVNTNVDYNVRLDTLRNSSSISRLNKNSERSTYKANTMLYKPSRVTLSANLPYKSDSSVRRLNIANKLKLKLNIPNMADALYDAGLIKDKTHFTAMITNDVLMVNGVKQSEANHQRILKKYQKKPGDKVNLSFTYPGK
jgi:beta-lactamase regulating signal transducer with metallopeptidase domain